MIRFVHALRKEAVISDGKIIRRVHQRYDAHHIIELDRGGMNTWWNIHPAYFPDEHQAGIHGKDSALKELHEIIDAEKCK